MAIYTKNGDAGETALYGGKRVRKSVDIVAALGEFDELNAFLGLSKLLLKKSDILKISQIQNDLFLLGSVVAGIKLTPLTQKYLNQRVVWMEKEIDELDAKTPLLQNFILPSGCESSVRLHLVRAICRRCERSLVALGECVGLVPYLNRLSDYLFILARYENIRRNIKDEVVIAAPR